MDAVLRDYHDVKRGISVSDVSESIEAKIVQLSAELDIDPFMMLDHWLILHQLHPEITWDDYASILRADLFHVYTSDYNGMRIVQSNRSVSLTDKAEGLVRKACDSVGKKLGLSVEYDL